MGGPSQSLLDALHGVQLWGIVRSDTGGRCGSIDEFLVAFKRLEEEVSNVEEVNAKLRKLVCDLWEDILACDEEWKHERMKRMREAGIEVE